MALPLNVVYNYSSRFSQQFYIFRVEKAFKEGNAVEIEAGSRKIECSMALTNVSEDHAGLRRLWYYCA